MARLDAWQDAIVQSLTDITADIRLFEIRPQEAFVPPSAGSHIKVSVRIGNRADIRSYSVVGPCSDGIYRIAVKRLANSRGGSAFMWSLPTGARLTIAPPHNHFEITFGQPEYVLVAGGVGITPIYSMALALADGDAPVRVLYACRSPADLAFAEALRARIGDRLSVYVKSQGPRIDFPGTIAAMAPGGELYVCGPLGMLDAARAAWRASGRPGEKLRFETFGSSGHQPAEAFTIRIPRLGLEIAVQPNQSMLDAIEGAGVEMIYDCRRGECGLCALPVLHADGVVDHRDVFFSKEEKAAGLKLCTCVSRLVGTSITLDTPDRLA